MARVSKIASQPSQPAKATIHILKIDKKALAKIARESRMSSQPSQPLKAHIHIRKISLDKMARALKIASQPSQLAKATIHILKSDKTCLGQNSERFMNVKSTNLTTKSTHTYSKTSLS